MRPSRFMTLPAVAAWVAVTVIAACMVAPSSVLAFGTEPGIAGQKPLGHAPGLTIPDDALAPSRDLPGDETDTARPTDDGAPSVTGPLPTVHYDLGELPPPVAAMRLKIIEAAKSGDVEALRPVIELSKPAPLFSSLGEGDPIELLKAASGDDAGREIMAILLDVLDAGYVIRNEGTPQARYVWPYFAEFPPDTLTPRQLVELYRVMTAGDFDEMRGAGSYEFYRLELGADGRWLLFMSGD